MKPAEIYMLAPGSRVLISCSVRAQEMMIENLCSSMPDDFEIAARLNTCSVAFMDIAADRRTNGFGDLHELCRKLISVAGRRSHFRGLLFLNIAGLKPTDDNRMRLKALGEMLALRDGLASECVTVLYGPDNERDLLLTANLLDFDGRLNVTVFEPHRAAGIYEMLMECGLRTENSRARAALEAALKEVECCADFDAVKFLRSCADDGGIITAKRIRELLDEPYSYINRVRKAVSAAPETRACKTVGFSMNEN